MWIAKLRCTCEQTGICIHINMILIYMLSKYKCEQQKSCLNMKRSLSRTSFPIKHPFLYHRDCVSTKILPHFNSHRHFLKT